MLFYKKFMINDKICVLWLYFITSKNKNVHNTLFQLIRHASWLLKTHMPAPQH